ncbi:hypothetical protein EJB05_48149, partial [Eragrostis curvula]
MWDSGFTEFKLDYEGIGDTVLSDEFSAGGHIWCVRCFPRGMCGQSEYLFLYLEFLGESKNVKAIFEAFLMDRDGKPSSLYSQRCVRNWHVGFYPRVYVHSVKRSDLKNFVMDGHVTFMFGAIVHGDDNPIAVSSSNMGDHFGSLLNHTDGSDVSFSVGGEIFPAHRAVLAARSPVFRAQLFGSLADAKMPCITLHDIQPSTFKILLRFIYTDVLPTDEELESSSTMELFQNLLATADMYHLDRLKLLCAQKLWERVSAETVAAILACAEMNNCQELKNSRQKFKDAVLTEGYLCLMQSFPSIIDEIRARLQT